MPMRPPRSVVGARPWGGRRYGPAMPIEAELDALLRLVLAGVAAGLLGIERETQDKPAGTRTFMVVGIGACLFTVASESAFGGGDDPTSRVIAQIVTGVGFLGAGTIIQVKDRVEGLTTAAGIWAVAAVGMTFGLGLYVLGIGSTIVLLVAIAILGRVLPRVAWRDRRQLADPAPRGGRHGRTRISSSPASTWSRRRGSPSPRRPCRGARPASARGGPAGRGQRASGRASAPGRGP